jgi:CDP-glucose 4,6-dehydratase
LKLLKKFYNNKRVLVTGHTGFKGTWLSIWLNRLGSKIYGISLPEDKSSMFKKCNIKQLFKNKDQYQDIRDYQKYKNKILKINPEIIFHMAAQPIVKIGYDSPINTFETNILGTANTINISRDLKSLKSLIIITTDKCYKDTKKNGYTEKDILGGYDPYSSSKACAELITDSMRSSYFSNSNIQVSTVRAGNVVGGGDWSDKRLVPDLIRSIKNKNSFFLRNPNFVRPWQHVLDPLFGYLILAAKSQKFSGSWNFGPQKGNVSVKKFIQKLSKNLETKIKIINKKENFKETNILNLNINKSKKLLNWRPKINIDLTAKLTAEWYKYNFKFKNDEIYNYTLNQIKFYEKLNNR